MSAPYELGFIGAGNMAEGIAAGLLGRGVYRDDQLIASDPAPARRDVFTALGVAVTEDNARVVADSSIVLLAIKPQGFAAVADGLRPEMRPDHLVISIMAGIGSDGIAAALGDAAIRVVRVMPNLPIRVGAGIAGVCGGAAATPDDVATAARIFAAGGESVVVSDESKLDAVTAVSGSGPAYFYAFVEAIVAGGVAAGLDEADALKLAEHTCLGAARMMLETGEPPADLRRKVTSPGGTTQAALESMARAGVPKAIRDAVVASAERSRELGQ
ncbi:MAG TPA: pyrroline-5-carboxylate reductase [Mycobacterium sp.]|jgi:pyrroline-5-carboxylate reductase